MKSNAMQKYIGIREIFLYKALLICLLIRYVWQKWFLYPLILLIVVVFVSQEASLYTVKAIAILDNDGERVVAKVYLNIKAFIIIMLSILICDLN